MLNPKVSICYDLEVPTCVLFIRYAESFKDFRDFPPVKTNADAVAFTVLLKVREAGMVSCGSCFFGVGVCHT